MKPKTGIYRLVLASLISQFPADTLLADDAEAPPRASTHSPSLILDAPSLTALKQELAMRVVTHDQVVTVLLDAVQRDLPSVDGRLAQRYAIELLTKYRERRAIDVFIERIALRAGPQSVSAEWTRGTALLWFPCAYGLTELGNECVEPILRRVSRGGRLGNREPSEVEMELLALVALKIGNRQAGRAANGDIDPAVRQDIVAKIKAAELAPHTNRQALADFQKLIESIQPVAYDSPERAKKLGIPVSERFLEALKGFDPLK